MPFPVAVTVLAALGLNRLSHLHCLPEFLLLVNLPSHLQQRHLHLTVRRDINAIYDYIWELVWLLVLYRIIKDFSIVLLTFAQEIKVNILIKSIII